MDCISKAALIPWAAKATAEYTKKILLRIRGLRMPDERFYETLYLRSKKQPKFAKETAARIGSNAHKRFDDYLLALRDMKNDVPYAESFRYWLKTEKIKIVKGDTKIASKDFGYGGSLDALGVDSAGNFVILDFKTGNYLYDTHALQVAAYGQAFLETYGVQSVGGAVVIRFEKNKPQYERREVRDLIDSFQTFRAALDLSKHLKLVHFKNRELIKLNKKEKSPHEATSTASSL